MTIQGPSVLLLGPPGAGKTHSISTLLRAGLEVFVVITEPGGLETLLDVVRKQKLPLDRLHWRVITPARPGFTALAAMAKKVTQLNFEALSKMGPTSRDNAQFLQVVDAFSNFRCDRTGEAFGAIDNFGPDRAVVVDSLSGLNIMAMDLTIGDKITAHQGEWGVAMNMIDKLLMTLTSNLRCLFVLLAHIEREQDESTMSTKLMVSTLGRKLAPRIPRFFSEVVYCYQEGENYFWSTSNIQMDLKHRTLPIGSKLPPTFEPIVAAYRERLKQVNMSMSSSNQQPATSVQ